jgi:hypothetical protein
VWEVDGATILARFGFRTLFWGCIDRDSDGGVCGQFSQHAAHTHGSQPVERDLSVGQGCVDTGPLPLEEGRMGDLRQRSRLRFAQQSITQGKQGIRSTLQAVADLLTTFGHDGKVHVESAPGFLMYWNSPPSGNLLQEEIACVSFCLNVN